MKLKDLSSSRKELEEELQKLESTNQTLIFEEHGSKQELEDARKEAVDVLGFLHLFHFLFSPETEFTSSFIFSIYLSQLGHLCFS